LDAAADAADLLLFAGLGEAAEVEGVLEDSFDLALPDGVSVCGEVAEPDAADATGCFKSTIFFGLVEPEASAVERSLSVTSLDDDGVVDCDGGSFGGRVGRAVDGTSRLMRTGFGGLEGPASDSSRERPLSLALAAPLGRGWALPPVLLSLPALFAVVVVFLGGGASASRGSLSFTFVGLGASGL
jgi:hypothetical protein